MASDVRQRNLITLLLANLRTMSYIAVITKPVYFSRLKFCYDAYTMFQDKKRVEHFISYRPRLRLQPNFTRNLDVRDVLISESKQ